jgi:APA family basic amino acid/polyamine antiporter
VTTPTDPAAGPGNGRNPGHPAEGELPRALTFFDSTMINIGSMIGSGIFIVPAAVAFALGSSGLMLAVWVAGGIVSLFGAISVAELGGMHPKAGGQYVYLREAFSPFAGFLYGWTSFAVINTGAIAAVAMTGATYVGFFTPLSPFETDLVAVAGIWVLTAVNCIGIRPGATVQNVLTMIKIGTLAAIPVAALLLPGGDAGNFAPLWDGPGGAGLAGTLGVAMIAVLWSYDGWIEITYVAGEVKDPGRNLHRSLVVSTAAVVLLYAAVTAAFTYLLSPAGMAASPLVASDAVSKMAGPAGAALVAAAVIVSTFGAANGFIITCPRIYYAMAREGMFFRWCAEVHPRFLTPVPSLLVQAGLATAMVLTGTFGELTTYVVFASFLFYGLSAAAVIVLRVKDPSRPRPYRTWGYPWTPLVFILFSGWLVADTIAGDPYNAMLGAAVILAGVPAYLFWRRRVF